MNPVADKSQSFIGIGEGEKIPVFVYTNGDCAELFLNGISQGKRCKKPDSEISIERYRLMWLDVEYEPGELKAVAFKNEKEILQFVRSLRAFNA